MNKINLNLDKSKKHVVACSFGPDSMALLHAAIENGLNVVVAHVNYRKRDAAIFEQHALEKFCKDRGIKIYVLDLLGEKHDGNFQNWAREKRYQFFKNIAEKEGADSVLVAHQQDDVLETYLMQKKRGNLAKNPGIPEKNELFGVQIIRPLLQYSKEELKNFDDENSVPYSIDESNLTNDYTRNKIRHEIVEKLSAKERKNLLKEIETKEKAEVQTKTIWEIGEFCNLTYEQIVRLLDFYMSKTNTHRNISQKLVSEIKKAFRGQKNCSFDITSDVALEKDYDSVYLVNTRRLKNYEFCFEKKLENAIFDIDFEFGAEDRNVPLTSKKLIVKNIPVNTEVIIKNYSADINRLFIDWKMPHYLRKVWPGIYDENGKLLYVPRYRKNFKDKHKSKFVFRTNYFTEF